MLRSHTICSLTALALLLGCKSQEDQEPALSLQGDELATLPAGVVEAAPSQWDTSMQLVQGLPSQPATDSPTPRTLDSVPCIESPTVKADLTYKTSKPPKPRSKTKAGLSVTKAPPSLEQAPQTALAATEAQVDSLDGLPWQADQINPLLLALYEEAQGLKDSMPDSAMTRVNFALRYCDDAAFYALGAEILYRDGNLYRSIVLAERATLFPSGLNPDAAEVGLSIQGRALRKVKEANPSEELSGRFNRLAAAYHLRYQKPLEAN